MRPREKAAILKCLKDTEASLLKEQGDYRKILAATAEATADDGLLIKYFEAFDWERIEKHMEGYTWPLESQDWQMLNISWDETSKQKLLIQIPDKDVRFATYFCSEASDHTSRLKTMAHFYSVFPATNKDIVLMFLAWKVRANLKIMQAISPSLAGHSS